MSEPTIKDEIDSISLSKEDIALTKTSIGNKLTFAGFIVVIIGYSFLLYKIPFYISEVIRGY
jgi:hypothetical protein